MQTDGSPLASFREIHKNAYLKIVPPANNNKLLPINQRVLFSSFLPCIVVMCEINGVFVYRKGRRNDGG